MPGKKRPRINSAGGAIASSSSQSYSASDQSTSSSTSFSTSLSASPATPIDALSATPIHTAVNNDSTNSIHIPSNSKAGPSKTDSSSTAALLATLSTYSSSSPHKLEQPARTAQPTQQERCTVAVTEAASVAGTTSPQPSTPTPHLQPAGSPNTTDSPSKAINTTLPSPLPSSPISTRLDLSESGADSQRPASPLPLASARGTKRQLHYDKPAPTTAATPTPDKNLSSSSSQHTETAGIAPRQLNSGGKLLHAIPPFHSTSQGSRKPNNASTNSLSQVASTSSSQSNISQSNSLSGVLVFGSPELSAPHPSQDSTPPATVVDDDAAAIPAGQYNSQIGDSQYNDPLLWFTPRLVSNPGTGPSSDGTQVSANSNAVSNDNDNAGPPHSPSPSP